MYLEHKGVIVTSALRRYWPIGGNKDVTQLGYFYGLYSETPLHKHTQQLKEEKTKRVQF